MAERLLSRSAPARNDSSDPHIPGIRQEMREAADAVRLCAAEVSVYDPASAQELVVHYRAILKLADTFRP